MGFHIKKTRLNSPKKHVFLVKIRQKKSWLKVDGGKGFAQPNISQGGYTYTMAKPDCQIYQQTVVKNAQVLANGLQVHIGPCHLSGIPLQKGFFPLSQRDFYFINCC
jgi:hypothetical protein